MRPLTLGATPPTDTPFDAGRVFGLFDWRGNGTALQGDWRAFCVDGRPWRELPAGAGFLMHTVWADAPTDIDLSVYGPAPRESIRKVLPEDGDCRVLVHGFGVPPAARCRL